MFKNYLKLYTDKDLFKYNEFTLSVPQTEKPEIGFPMKFQTLISNIMNGVTNVDGLLLVHELGTGKSCTAISAIERNIQDKIFGMKRGLILNKGKSIMNNFINELVTKCTTQYNVGNDFLNKKLWSKFYEFNTFEMFAKKIASMPRTEILKNYNNTLVVIDEVHHLINEDGTIYREIHSFLHTIPSLKILLLSGTPIRDNAEDFIPVINLILPETQQLEKDTWKTLYFSYNEPNIRFKQLLSTRVSYLKAERPEIKILNVGSPMYQLKKYNVVEHTMSPFQNKHYNRALLIDKNVYNDAKQASRFVFPDGSWGTKGYEKYITRGRVVKSEFKTYLEELGTSREQILHQIGVCSVKYKYLIEKILQATEDQEKTLVYDELISGSGLNTLAALLNFIGYRKYRLLTSETGVGEIKRIQKQFNSDPHGKSISVLMGSRVIAEGFTFNDVIHEHVVPHWNNTETKQIIGRGIRLNSHRLLIEEVGVENISVKVYRHMVVGNRYVDSIDYRMYKVSEEKQIEIDKIIDAIKESSLTCEAFNQRNGGKCLFADGEPKILSNLPYANKHDNTVVDGVIAHFQNKKQDGFQNIVDALKTSQRDTLDALQYMVENKIPIYKSGLASFLWFDRDKFFLSPVADCYYNSSINTYANEFVPNYSLYDSNYESVFENAINLVKPDLQTSNIQRLIELSLSVEMFNLTSKYKKINKPVVDKILKDYKNYYTVETVDDNKLGIVSYEEEILRNKSRRCIYLPKTQTPWNEWTKCNNKLFAAVDTKTINNDRLLEQQMRERNVKYYGLKHPESGDFCLKDVVTKPLSASDKRKIHSGKRCINWSKQKLLEIASDKSPKQTRQQLCNIIEDDFKNKNLIFESRSCGVQFKRK